MTPTPAVLGICASMKPPMGAPGKSAIRGLLTHAISALQEVYPNGRLIDLREAPLPFFDGQLPTEHSDVGVRRLHDEIAAAGALLLGIPAYWSGASGVFKNMIDVLCGPAYDKPGEGTVFTDKPTGIVLVGADDASAVFGLSQAERILKHLGARLIDVPPVVIANPRKGVNDHAITQGLVVLAARLAQIAMQPVQEDEA